MSDSRFATTRGLLVFSLGLVLGHCPPWWHDRRSHGRAQ